jgi:hypothetical protein
VLNELDLVAVVILNLDDPGGPNDLDLIVIAVFDLDDPCTLGGLLDDLDLVVIRLDLDDLEGPWTSAGRYQCRAHSQRRWRK